jgi:antitoxin component of MazEF toxin-antitoxin module
MEILIVRTGNSKGIRLSKTILKKYEIKDSVEVVTEKDFIVLKPKTFGSITTKDIVKVKTVVKETFVD